MPDDEQIKALARTFAKRCEESIRQHIDGMYLTFSGEMADTIRTALNEYAETLKSQDVYHELASRAEHLDMLKTQLAKAREVLEKIDDCFRKGHYAEGALILRAALSKMKEIVADD